MSLRIKKAWLRLASFLYYGGFVVLILSIPYLMLKAANTDELLTEAWASKTAFSMIIPGCMMISVGDNLEYHLYRCPNCKHHLLKKGGGFSQAPSTLCKNCGRTIIVRIE